jgi:hypothetical protein
MLPGVDPSNTWAAVVLREAMLATVLTPAEVTCIDEVFRGATDAAVRHDWLISEPR